MPPRLSGTLHISQPHRSQILLSSRYASAAVVSAATSMPSVTQTAMSASSISHYRPTQPPSHRSPEFHKSQLHRQYTSLLRTAPLILIFQHNNLRSVEWAGIRRELNQALRKVDEAHAALGRTEAPLASLIKLQIIQTSIFESALRVVDYFRPKRNIPAVATAIASGSRDDPSLTHDLSRAAYKAVLRRKGKHELSTILIGPLAVLTFPLVSPEHLKAALSILAPSPPLFPSPPRKANPGYHDLTVQAGLKKLMLLAARVEGKVFDVDGTRWVGSIQDGISGLRSQLVALLQAVGGSITGALEGSGKSLYLTLESRRSVLDQEEQKTNGDPKEVL